MAKEKTVSSILKDYCENSTIHGFSRIVASQNIFWQLLWISLVLGTTGYLGFQMYGLLTAFYSWPVKTSVSLGFSPQSMPAISICNMNSIRKSKIDQTPPSFQKLLQDANNTAMQLSEFQYSTTSAYNSYPTSTAASWSSPPTSSGSTTPATHMTSTASTTTTTTQSPNTNVTVTDSFHSTTSNYYYDHWNNYGFENTEQDYEYNTDAYSGDIYTDGDWDTFLKYAPPNEEFKMNQRIKIAMNNMTEEKRKSIGHQIEDMLIQCSFGNRLCSKTDFKHFLNAEYGNCYTIGLPYPKVRQSGEQYGISLTMNVEKTEYLGGLETGYGVRLTIHDHSAVPFPAEEGITLSAGYETYIGMKSVKIVRMSEPYGNCSQNRDFRKQFGIEYSVPVCRLICLMDHIHEECRCDFRTFMPDLYYVLSSRNASIDVEDLPNCKDTNETLECSGKARAVHTSGESSMECKHPCFSRCSEKVYTTRSSGRLWPTVEYMKKMQKKLCANSSVDSTFGCDDYNSGQPGESFTNNFLRVKIYFEDLNYETITEEPMYQTVRFISDIGGTLGLFIGASMLSVAEIVCLVVALVTHVIRRAMSTKVSPFKNTIPDAPEMPSKNAKPEKDLSNYTGPLGIGEEKSGRLPGSIQY